MFHLYGLLISKYNHYGKSYNSVWYTHAYILGAAA
jgi:hypothetical protein